MEWIYKYFSLTAVIAGLGFLMKYLIQKQVDSYFGKRLEDHKQELTVMTEKAKYDISRKLFDFEAYAIKKHTIYPELYQQMFQIRQEFVTYATFNPKNTEEEDKEYERFLGKTSESIKLLSIYFNKNELFLSIDVVSAYSTTFDEIIRGLSLAYTVNQSFKNNVIITESNYHELCDRFIFEKIDAQIHILKEVMYKELSYSHFEETEEKAKQSS